MRLSRGVGAVTMLIVGVGLGFVLGASLRSPTRDDPRCDDLRDQLSRAREALAAARCGAAVLEGRPPPAPPPASDSSAAIGEKEGRPALEPPLLDRRARLEAAWAAYLAAEDALRPEDQREPFPQGPPSEQLWGPIPKVMDILREEDASAYVAWRVEADTAFVRKYVRVPATDRDVERFRSVLADFQERQVRALLEARRAWEDPQATAEERAQRRRAFDAAYADAAQARNRTLAEMAQSIGRVDASEQPFLAYPP